MAYWSVEKPEIFHICLNCPEYNRITESNMLKGEPPPGAKKCLKCRDLDDIGRCAVEISHLPKSNPEEFL
jgi:hypothetical protein